MANTILKNKNKADGNQNNPVLKERKRSMGQNRNPTSEPTQAQPTKFNKRTDNNTGKKVGLLNSVQIIGYPQVQEKNNTPSATQYKLKSRWIKDLIYI